VADAAERPAMSPIAATPGRSGARAPDELSERLIVGCGAHGRLRPHPAVVEALRERGIEVETLHTDEAVRRYGESDERRTAAALHLTC
jgi:hypothetical protein